MKKRKGPGRPRKYPRLEGDAQSSQDVNSESEGVYLIYICNISMLRYFSWLPKKTLYY